MDYKLRPNHCECDAGAGGALGVQVKQAPDSLFMSLFSPKSLHFDAAKSCFQRASLAVFGGGLAHEVMSSFDCMRQTFVGAVWLERLGGRKKDERSDLSHYIRCQQTQKFISLRLLRLQLAVCLPPLVILMLLSETAVGLLLLGASVAKSGGVRGRKKEKKEQLTYEDL